MPLQTKTLAQLLVEIKAEAKLDGTDNLDAYIKATINELLLNYIETVHYQELMVRDVAITTVDATELYDLPTDFQAPLNVRYRVAPTGGFRFLTLRPQFVQQAVGSYPNYYDIVGGQLRIYPAESVKTTDTLRIDYYKYPDELVEDSDVFPIPKLIVPIKRQAISRALLYNRDTAIASAFDTMANNSETRSRVSDTPVRG